MKVLVTGGTGFIGQHLACRLLKEKHRVSVLTRDSAKAKSMFRGKAIVFQADITDKKSLQSIPCDFDWIFHLAAAVSYRKPKKCEFHKTNVLGSKNVLKAAIKMSNLKKIVYLSSVGVYGPIKNPPADETYAHKPENDYEISKNQGEQAAGAYIKKGLPINIIQPALVYGPGDTSSGMFALFKAVNSSRFMKIGKKEIFMHTVYIDNVIDALMLAAQKKIAGEDFIIADRKPISLEKLSSVIAKETKSISLPFYLPYTLAKSIGTFGDISNKFGLGFPLSSSIVYFMTHHRAYNIAKAKKLLGYKAKISLREGVRRTASWYKKKRIL